MNTSLGFVLSYLVGSIPTAYCVGKIVRGVDIRQFGSGNVGATNAFRVIGKRWGIGVLIFDMLKGYIAAKVIPHFIIHENISHFLVALTCGIAAVAGHTWTIWLRFRGGKGAATSAGAALGLVPGAASAALFTWALVIVLSRYVSLATLAATASFPLWTLFLYRQEDYFGILFPVGFLFTGFIF